MGSLDLSKLILADPGSELAKLNEVQKAVIENLPEPLTGAVDDAIAQAQQQFGNPGLVAGFGAVEGRCTAAPGSASGDAILANVKVTLNLPTGAPKSSITLLNLPVHPKPNTHLTTNLSDVLEHDPGRGQHRPPDVTRWCSRPARRTVVAAIKENIVKGVRDNVEKNLAPARAEPPRRRAEPADPQRQRLIKVRALDLSLVPAVAPQLGAPLATLQIGNADCGPNGRTPSPAPQAAPPKAKGLPTGVSAGYATTMPPAATRRTTTTPPRSRWVRSLSWSRLGAATAGYGWFCVAQRTR